MRGIPGTITDYVHGGGYEQLEFDLEMPPDAVNHPPHYKNRVPGIECIQVTKHFGFSKGNAIKYIWRAGLKGGRAQEIEDLEKAVWYLQQEIMDLRAAQAR